MHTVTHTYTHTLISWLWQVKEFIKRAKAWRNSVWERVKEGKPKSFFLSVLVLRAHELARKKLGDTSTKRMATQ